MKTLDILGAPGSPYTRKMLSVLRYRRIGYRLRIGSHGAQPAHLPDPRVKLLPTIWFHDGEAVEVATDSTPIITRLDAARPGREVRPADPLRRFLDLMIEDYADEWLTKAMFHYRWAHEADARNAGPQLAWWRDTTLSDAEGMRLADALTARQTERLRVVGSSPVTAPTIEGAWSRLIDLLNRRIEAQGFVMGARPGAADFALYGQLTQLGVVEPTPAAMLAVRAPRLRAWIDRMEDLSGLEPADDDWLPDPAALTPLLVEIGRTHAPFLRANAAAAMAGETAFETGIDGRPWTQPVFPYQAKCLAALRAAHAALPGPARAEADALLAGTGCETLFA